MTSDIQRAADLIADGEFEAAEPLLMPFVETSAWAATLLGGLRQRCRDNDAARELYARAIRLPPSEWAATADDCLDALSKGMFLPWGKGVLADPIRQVFMAELVTHLSALGRRAEILEVGSYVGISALTWAHAADTFLPYGSRILCVDPWDTRPPAAGERTYAFFKSGLMLDAFKRNVATAPRSIEIRHRRGLSVDVLPTLDPGTFDLVYLDGSHIYADAIADIRNADRLVRDGGYVCGDDLELTVEQVGLEYASAYRGDDTAPNPHDPRGWFHVGVALAVHEFYGAVPSYGGFWAMQKTASSYRPVQLGVRKPYIPPHLPRRAVEALNRRIVWKE